MIDLLRCGKLILHGERRKVAVPLKSLHVADERRQVAAFVHFQDLL